MRMRLWMLGLVLTTGLSPTGALSGEGVVEINQICATQTGCLPGDDPGFPVTIGTVGSYRLTSGLGVVNGTAIEVTTPRVTLDLGGFTLSCRTVTFPSGSPCTSGVGVNAEQEYVTLKNGTVLGFGNDGVVLGPSCTVENVRSESNGGRGIVAIDSDERCHVRNSTARANGGAGIEVSGVLVDNISTLNRADGIRASGVLRNNVAYGNLGDGIFCSRGTIIGNHVSNNRGCGINMLEPPLPPLAGYGQNVVTTNNGSSANLQVKGGLEIGENVCGINTTRGNGIPTANCQ